MPLNLLKCQFSAHRVFLLLIMTIGLLIIVKIIYDILLTKHNPNFILDGVKEKNIAKEYDSVKDFQVVMTKRLQHVRKVCLKNSSSLRRIFDHKKIFWSKQLHVAYCGIPKVGTTTWLSKLLRWANISTIGLNSTVVHALGHQVFSFKSVKEALEEMKRTKIFFMVVRHPFSRLVSAYRDKVLSGYHYDRLSNAIFNDTTSHLEKINVKKMYNSSIKISFQDFAMYVAKEILACKEAFDLECFNNIDVHWVPYYDKCAPCDFPYNVISKIETFEEDALYIEKRLHEDGSSTSVVDAPIHLNKNHDNSLNLTYTYIYTLSRYEQQLLYKAYYYDFLLFNYDPFMQ